MASATGKTAAATGWEVQSTLVRIAISVCGFLLFGIIAVHGPWGAGRIEAELRAATQARLVNAGFSWVRADADGQAILLSGTPPDEAHRKAAVELSMKAVGPGGPAIGGVTSVKAAFLPPPAPAPAVKRLADYRFVATFSGGDLRFAGMVPSEQARKTLSGIPKEAEDVALHDTTALAPLDEEADWLSTSAAALHALLMLDAGEMRQEGAAFTLSGKAANAAVAEAAESLAAGAAGDFAFTVQIAQPAAPSVESAAICQSEINRALNGRRLLFQQKSAWLSAADRAFLDQFSQEISVCRGQTIVVEGHTDATGSAKANLALSRRRAEAVRTYLETVGGDTTYMIKAYGETRPVASNRTKAGQRSNRRIDFVVAADDGESE